MAAILSPNALRPVLSLSKPCPSRCPSCLRQESTFRRTRKALRVKPDPSFAPSKTETQDHIIFNPPSSAPNVYHTPQIFLPPTDPRRKLHSLAKPLAATSPPAEPATSAKTLNPLRPQYEKKYHLKEADIAEIRRLRALDPRKWTRVRLAEKFECSAFFVSLCCCAPEIKEERDRELAEVKRKWGRKKTEAREERQARKALWGRDG